MTNDTCSKEEYLEIQDKIYKLASIILTKEELSSAEQISIELTSSKKVKEAARHKLINLVGTKPKRPLYYVCLDLRFLPSRTRNPIRYLGDYIDHLIKHWSSEINGDASLTKSLGENLVLMKGRIDKSLRQKLVDYNNLCYVPAKHDFQIKGCRKHRFTAKETVFISFITINLGKEILKYSEGARNYVEGVVDDNWAKMQYNPKNVDSFAK